MSLDDNSKLDLSDIDRVFVVWVLLVILWNYGYPSAEPLYDVIVSIGLFIIVKILRTRF